MTNSEGDRQYKYRLEDGALVVLVVAVGRREDNAAYESAMARLLKAAGALSNAVRTAMKNVRCQVLNGDGQR